MAITRTKFLTLEQINDKFERASKVIQDNAKSYEAAKLKFPNSNRTLKQTYEFFELYEQVNDGLDLILKQGEYWDEQSKRGNEDDV